MSYKDKDIIEIVARERKNFLQYVRRRLTDISDMDAEDIVADVIFNVYNKVDIQHHVESLLAYMYRSIRNKTIDYLRQPAKPISLDVVDEISGIQISEVLADPHADIDAYLRREELRGVLYEALLELEPNQRAVWVATELEGYTFKELSAKWGEPIGTLLSRKSRATSLLRKALKAVM